ncbi:hypothetical protein IP91_00431 [Pseudoduganella lurida]|uniref:Type VI secretion system tip protein VgrG n=1 Tax=Pseudoduganella lurida TaxID=1036180 RepID=A0A562RKA7_9BURK|nr:hypothetical protein [Pseudoduganella lurida]TWI69363.1 hypothetical protein IP91_00431 [Pseudoduganella lurida]
MSDLPGLLRADLRGLTQETRLIRLATPLGSDALLAECVRGGESPGGGGTRSFHGHVTAAQGTGANGGLARYQLTIGHTLPANTAQSEPVTITIDNNEKFHRATAP